MKSCKVHNVCLNQDVSEYLPKTSLFPKEMHETTLKTVKKRSVKLAKMPWHHLPALEMDFLELQNSKWHALNGVGK